MPFVRAPFIIFEEEFVPPSVSHAEFAFPSTLRLQLDGSDCIHFSKEENVSTTIRSFVSDGMGWDETGRQKE
jgi:hypothetical protein